MLSSCLIIVYILHNLHSFKHNTSFVSRFSTIRRHKSATHSPLTRSRWGASASEHGQVTREDSLSGTRDSRMPGSLSEDSVAKEVSDASKRNSEGKLKVLFVRHSFLSE